jgi:hypothetical protein
MGVGGGCRARGADHVAPVSRNRERRLLNHVCRCCSAGSMDGGVKVLLALVMQALWERACSRKRCVRRHGCWLLWPLREQARSHSWISFCQLALWRLSGRHRWQARLPQGSRCFCGREGGRAGLIASRRRPTFGALVRQVKNRRGLGGRRRGGNLDAEAVA